MMANVRAERLLKISAEPSPRAAYPGAAAQTRLVSRAGIRLGPWESARAFKGIICDDISEFESCLPSHAVRSLWLIYGTSKNARHSTRLARLKRARPRAGAWRTISSVARLALRQKAVRRSHRLRHDNWVIGSRCRQNSFSSGTTSVLRAVFASRDEPMASAPALPEATVSGQFVQI